METMHWIISWTLCINPHDWIHLFVVEADKTNVLHYEEESYIRKFKVFLQYISHTRIELNYVHKLWFEVACSEPGKIYFKKTSLSQAGSQDLSGRKQISADMLNEGFRCGQCTNHGPNHLRSSFI